MARKTRKARKSRKTRKQRGGEGQRLGFKNNTTPKMIHAKCAECMRTKSTKGFCNLSTCGNYCAIERAGNRADWNICRESDTCLKHMDPKPYLQGKSRILIEDSIAFVEPEGEICYGGTITTCTTVTVVFDDKSKIGIHINPQPLLERNIFPGVNPFTPDIPNKYHTPNPIITYENLWDKIRELRRQNNKLENTVYAVYIISSPNLILRGIPEIVKGHIRSATNSFFNVKSSLLNKTTLRDLVQTNVEKFTENTVFEYDPDISLQESKDPEHHLVIKANGTLDGKYDHSL
jgi:hypothetical protein